MEKFLGTLEPYSDEFRNQKPLKFRNYVPRDKDLSAFVVEAPTKVLQVEILVDREARNALKDFEKQQNEPLTIAPKKANWDLKRNLERKSEKLNDKTEKAIKKLIKLQNSK
ncbi:hypothetical protein SteCoe_24995 [Stentor coeruleus]|uniref:Cwf18 pre-mRNA splicing factor n=1 Tax=Stentor coeruleus TaxID=5963 RepID=A0A1R2BG92_9CILI|nr:hypothetical protein SteCoe_24995 [Stentor coeruleus]